ncbi:MAG: choice-of-anchor D domain-containing protein [Clostridium sp.]|nr:choice-of-anchor D domain-containing protein [Clostridium sp.]
MFINPTNFSEEPAASFEFAGSYVNDATNGFGQLIINQRLLSSVYSPNGSIDAVRVATSWADLFTDEAETPAEPSLEVSETFLEFDEIQVGTTSSQAVHISGQNLTEDIAVTVPDQFTVNATTITTAQAAEGFDLVVTYAPKSVSSVFGALTLKSGDLTQIVSLSASSFGNPTVTFSTKSITFNDVPVGTTAEQTFNIKAADLSANLILMADESVFTMEPDAIAPELAMSPEGCDVTVKFTPTKNKTIASRIYVYHQGNQFKNYIDLKGSGIAVTPELTVDVESIDFGSTHVGGNPVTRVVHLKGKNLAGDIEISGNEAPFTTGVTSIAKDKAENVNGYDLAVTFTPTSVGVQTATLTLTCGTLTYNVALTGEGLKALSPSITSVNPSRPKIDNVPLGTTGETIVNIKAKDLTYPLTVTFDDAEFSATETTIPAEAAMSAEGYNLTLTFTPTKAKQISCRMFIFHQDTQLKFVDITGIGVDLTPELTVDVESIDFGSTHVGGNPVTRVVHLKGKNLAGDIEISGIEAPFTTGVTSIAKDKAENVNGYDLAVTFTPTSVGVQTATLTLTCGTLTYNVALTGEGLKALSPSITSVNPSRPKIDNVPLGTTGETIVNIKAKDLTYPLTVTFDDAEFSATETTIPAEAAMSAEGYNLTLTFTPTKAKQISCRMFIFHQDTQLKFVDITGIGVDLTPELTVDVESIDFGSAYVGGNPVTRVVHLKGKNLAGDIEISGSEAPFTTGVTSIAKDKAENVNGYDLAVTFAPTEAGVQTGMLTLTCGELTCNIALTGEGLRNLEPAVTTVEEFDFGKVVLGETSEHVINIKAVDLTYPLTVSFNDDQFSTEDRTIPMDEAQSTAGYDLIVAFTPTDKETLESKMTIMHQGVPLATVKLSGTGIQPEIATEFAEKQIEAVQGVETVVTFGVTGTDLLSEISIEVEGENADCVTVAPETLPAEGGTVTVTFLSDKVGEHTVTLIFGSFKADDAVVELTFDNQQSTALEFIEAADQAKAYVEGGRILVVAPTEIAAVSVHNLAGTLLTKVAPEADRVAIDAAGFGKGTLIVTVTTTDGAVKPIKLQL